MTERDRKTERERESETDRQKKETERDRHTERERETKKEREREREREGKGERQLSENANLLLSFFLVAYEISPESFPFHFCYLCFSLFLPLAFPHGNGREVQDSRALHQQTGKPATPSKR